MADVMRYVMFLGMIVIIGFSILFFDKFLSFEKTFIIQKVFKQEDYKFWARVDGSNICKENPGSQSQLIKKLIQLNINIVYLENVDITSCSKFLPNIAPEFHYYGLSLALDLESNLDTKNIFDEASNSLKIPTYIERFKSIAETSHWVSYIVVNNTIDRLTFSERRQLQSSLREIFTRSFLGFSFTNEIKPTPQMKHPYRQDISWNEFLPRDDDGDFMIVTFPIGTVRRSEVFTENFVPVASDVDGQFVKIQ